MNTAELFESYKPGYDKELKILTGSQKDWMDAIGATKDDMAAAYSKAKSLSSYSALTKIVKDVSTDRMSKNGTFTFEKPNARHDDQYVVYANGQIRSQSTSSPYADKPAPTRLKSPKPRLKAGDVIQSLVMIYDGAFKELTTKASKRASMKEAITPMEKDDAEDSIGWWIVREKDDKCAWGPFTSAAKASKDLENHKGFATHGVSNDKIVYIEHGWCGDDNEFNEQKPD